MIRHPPAIAALLQRYRRQQPVRAGSLIVTVFGDAIAPRAGAISLGSLIELMTPFGIAERLVRTSVARLATGGWLGTRRLGRLSEYHLSASGRERFREATRRIYAGPSPEWSGRWTLVVMAGVAAKHRPRVRDTLAWEGFGEVQPGVLAHPTLAPSAARALLAVLGLDEEPTVLEATVCEGAGNAQLVAAGWDLSDLSQRYGRFLRHFEPLRALCDAGVRFDPPDAFIARTLLIHEYRKIHLRDPLLPPSLLPDPWPGTNAYALCRRVYAGVCPAAERHLGAVARRLDGPLPEARAELRSRFGGLSLEGDPDG